MEIAIATIVAAIVGLLSAVLTLCFGIRHKSYELLIKHRLETLDENRKNMSKLLYSLSQEAIDELKRQDCTVTEYRAKIMIIKCDLYMQMKLFDKQEKVLFNKIDEVYKLSLAYFEKSNVHNCLPCKLNELNELYANYDWAMWLYHQELHKYTPNKTKKYDKLYNKVSKQIEDSKEGKR